MQSSTVHAAVLGGKAGGRRSIAAWQGWMVQDLSLRESSLHTLSPRREGRQQVKERADALPKLGQEDP